MQNKDIRWIQRFSNYKKALVRLAEAVEMDLEALNDLEKEGLIQRFEFTYELAWKTLWDLLRYLGHNSLVEKPIPVIDLAIIKGYIADGDGWKRMRASRNLTSHTYDEAMANAIANDTVKVYYALLIQLETRLEIERLR